MVFLGDNLKNDKHKGHADQIPHGLCVLTPLINISIRNPTKPIFKHCLITQRFILKLPKTRYWAPTGLRMKNIKLFTSEFADELSKTSLRTF